MSAENKSSIGQAIDQITGALQQLEKREQEIVVATICSILDIAPIGKEVRAHGLGSSQAERHSAGSQSGSESSGTNTNQGSSGGRVDAQHPMDIRTLKELKQPSNVLQMACVVAFYLQEHAPAEEQTREITAADLERLFKQAGYKLPSRMQQVLVDAKSAGYFESVDRGKYKLTRVGYNLVTHSLPRATAK